MDIDQHVNQIVQNIVNQITTQVQQQAMAVIEQKISDVVASIDYTPMLSSLLNQKLDARLSKLPIDADSIERELKSRVDNLANAISVNVQEQSIDIVKETVTAQVGKVGFEDLYERTILSAIESKQVNFPDSSIPLSAVQLKDLKLSGNEISGGIIKNFGSTGIDDKATDCRLSIFDEVTVIENNLVTKDLTVKGTTTIEGDLNVTGTVPETSAFYIGLVKTVTNNVRTSIDHSVFDGYSDLVFAKVKEQGLDLNKITVDGKLVLEGSNLSTFITSSNLQSVGVLKDLQVSGEALLSQTLYTNSTRVGINTLEPAQALSIWDQEIEIGAGKLSNNTGIIGTPRNHSLVISANGKNNIVLTADGATTVNKINMGTMSFSVGDAPPQDNQPKGSIVFNSNPSLGGPLGWVSLGDARWANFGIID